MEIITMLAHFFLSEWLWSVAWGGYHVLIAMILTFVSLKFFLRLAIVPSVIMAFFSQLFAFLVYTLFVVVLLIFVIDISYDPEKHYALVPAVWNACLFLGLIYAVIQSFFFWLIHKRYSLNMLAIIMCVCISNGAAAALTYWLLPLD